MMNVGDPILRFYNDLSPSDQHYWSQQLQRSPCATNYTRLSYAAYFHHPITYLYCEQDQALPHKVQKMMVEGIRRQGVEVAEETCGAGHSPYLSMPERILELVASMSARAGDNVARQ